MIKQLETPFISKRGVTFNHSVTFSQCGHINYIKGERLEQYRRWLTLGEDCKYCPKCQRAINDMNEQIDEAENAPFRE